MCEEPSPDLTIEKANQIFSEIETEKEIADLFAVVENKARWIEEKEYDFEEGTELIANLFRNSQTEEKLRKDKIDIAETATKSHNTVGREGRKTIEEICGTVPEDLPTLEKSITQIEKEQMQRLKKKAKEGTLMLDE